MRKTLAACLIAGVLFAVQAAAQTLTPFLPTGNATMAVTTASSNIPLPSSAPTAWICNTGANTAYIQLGNSNTVATTVTLQAAGAAGVRNYIAGIQCDNTGALGTEVQILDGASIIWDRQIGAIASAQPGQISLPSGGIPLRGSAATAISLKTVSGTTISLLCSVQGYQAY